MDSRSKTGRRAAAIARRVVILVAVAVVAIGLEQLAQQWVFPTQAAELAVTQLQPSDEAAESLRLFEYGRRALWFASRALIVGAAVVLFVPLPRRWQRSIRRHVSWA